MPVLAIYKWMSSKNSISTLFIYFSIVIAIDFLLLKDCLDSFANTTNNCLSTFSRPLYASVCTTGNSFDTFACALHTFICAASNRFNTFARALSPFIYNASIGADT
jgi:hypothetical protein